MEESLKIQVDKIIDASVGDFLNMINSIAENGPFRKHRRLSPAFENLGTANNEFYEYAYFERSLEWFTRDFLINQSLMKLFHLAGIECLWPEKKKEVRFSNEAIENIYPFEFIVLQDEKRIGYRYTGLCENEVDDLIKDYHLDRIVQIDWKLKKKCNDNTVPVFTTVSFDEFLGHYFPDLDCESVIAKFKKAIKEANEDIGFETIPRLSLRYLSNFKDDIDYELSHEKYRDMRFLLLPDSKNNEDLSNIVLDDDDYKICDERFIKGKLYKSLLSEEGFAKCFVTAEYQYHVFKQGNSFDYTSVVCGYLKAIEQLLYKLLKINLDNPSSDRLWILSGKNVPKERQRACETTRRNPATGKWQVVFDKDFEMYFNITLSPMIWFLHDNVNGWLISDDGRKKVHKFLLNFANDCRNDHFHKDNIDDYEAVKGIRNNTILLAYLLIGGYKMTGNVEEDKKVLGI